MILDWKNFNNMVKMANLLKNNLQIYCDLYQITHGGFHRTRKNNPKIYLETQKTQK